MIRERRLRLGVAGLGRAFMLMLPTLRLDPRIELVAAADPRPEARERFAAEFGGRAYASVDALVRDEAAEVIYVATPHERHAAHAQLAAGFGKHVLVEKPMALSLAECAAMIDACAAANVRLVIGPSHSFDRPVLEARRIIERGDVGRVRMITALNFTDFLYRPRRPEELVTAQGGGVVFSQAAHQVDVVRLLAGTRATSIRAHTGSWDSARPTEGAYAALLQFEDGAFATLVYSGYAHFDSDEFCGGIGELGARKDPGRYGSARRRLVGVAPGADEARLKASSGYGGSAAGASPPTAAPLHEHFGPIVVCCERGDIRPLPEGVTVHGATERIVHPLPPPGTPRAEVIDELYAAVVEGKTPLHDGAWGMATLEVCLALLESASLGHDVALRHQVGLRAGHGAGAIPS